MQTTECVGAEPEAFSWEVAQSHSPVVFPLKTSSFFKLSSSLPQLSYCVKRSCRTRRRSSQQSGEDIDYVQNSVISSDKSSIDSPPPPPPPPCFTDLKDKLSKVNMASTTERRSSPTGWRRRRHHRFCQGHAVPQESEKQSINFLRFSTDLKDRTPTNSGHCPFSEHASKGGQWPRRYSPTGLRRCHHR